jgi:hypothetical protein
LPNPAGQSIQCAYGHFRIIKPIRIQIQYLQTVSVMTRFIVSQGFIKRAKNVQCQDYAQQQTQAKKLFSGQIHRVITGIAENVQAWPLEPAGPAEITIVSTIYSYLSMKNRILRRQPNPARRRCRRTGGVPRWHLIAEMKAGSW